MSLLEAANGLVQGNLRGRSNSHKLRPESSGIKGDLKVWRRISRGEDNAILLVDSILLFS